MSKIDKLSILGVRSFDNTRSETIQFHTPLTLIVGYNGSGKTTIIECLKYVTTGDLPPNSRLGGAFIHDPKLCGEKEVLAQVKLSFKASTGAKMVATRSLQLTVLKATRKQKTLEGQLLMIKDGERTAISSRVAELDQILPQYLGVSRAILDWVIFCHQDDGLWPMSEPMALKKRFDAIFEAVKYSKAIDNIKVLRKAQVEGLGKYRLLEQQYKIDKDRADRAEKHSRELAAEIEVLRGECQGLKEEIERTTRETERLWSQAAVFEQIVGTLKGKRIEAQTKQESINDLAKYVTMRKESDEWLASELEKYEERMPLLAAEIDAQLQRHESLKVDMERSRQRLGAKMTELGKYEAEKAQYERQLARRESLVKDAARRHGIRGFDTELDDGLTQEFMVRLGRMSRDQNANLDRTKRETRDELQRAQAKLNELGERRSALQQRKEHSRQEIGSSERKATAFLAELNAIAANEGEKAVIESAVEDTQAKLRKARADYEAAAWDDRVRTTNEQLRAVEVRSETLNGELVQRTRQAGDLARLDFLRREVRDREKSLTTLSDAFGDKLARVVGPAWEPSTVERDFQAVLDEVDAGSKEAERRRDGVSRELEQVDFALHKGRETSKRKTEELRRCRERVREAIADEPEEYPEVVSQLEQDRDIRKGDVDNFTHLRKYYEDCVKAAKEQSVCRLCRRHFDHQREFSQFVERLESLISKAGPQSLTDELREIEQDLRRAREAGPSYDTFKRLTDAEMPALEAELETLEERRESLLDQVDEHDVRVTQKQMERKDVEALTKTVQNIGKHDGEIRQLTRQAEELAAQQEQDHRPSRSVEAIQAELTASSDEARSLKHAASDIVGGKERGRSQINAYELELRDLRGKLAHASHQLEKRATLAGRVEECRTSAQTQQQAIEQADKETRDLEPAFAKARAQHDDVSSRGADRERDLQQDASRLSDSVRQLLVADQEIGAYVDKAGPDQLSRCQGEVEGVQAEIQRREDEQRQVTVSINEARKRLDQQDETKRTVSDNLRYRRDERALEAVQAEIAELEAKNAEVDRDRFVQEADRTGLRHRKLTAEEAAKMGAMKSKDDQLLKLLEDWNTDYKDAAKNFKEAHIKVEATTAAVEDLGRYASALDKAIMKYHGIKMDEINQILEELWKKTYQGTDVDTVLIRSDIEGGKGNKSYNYRVCMVKQDVEMDMRGRCSAGQKVLACILIRLALAECFGVSCGLIALDEPTTNLDRDNIRSLAESLHDIIRSRQQQSNFQLIVITHDEEFLRFMKVADFCDHYYRVSRNERQKSIIERNSVSQIAG